VSYEVYGPFLPLIMLITFVALFIWVANPKNSKKFDEAAQAPFADEEDEQTNKSRDTEQKTAEPQPDQQDDGANNGRDEK